MLATVGGVLNLVGVVVAAVGLSQTWREFGAESFWQPVTTGATRAGQATNRWVRTVLRRPSNVKAAAGAAEGAAAAFDATVRRTWAPLPDPDAYLAAFAAMVQQRLTELHDAQQDSSERLAAESKARTAADTETRARLDTEVHRARTYTQDVALHGVRLGRSAFSSSRSAPHCRWWADAFTAGRRTGGQESHRMRRPVVTGPKTTAEAVLDLK